MPLDYLVTKKVLPRPLGTVQGLKDFDFGLGSGSRSLGTVQG